MIIKNAKVFTDGCRFAAKKTVYWNKNHHEGGAADVQRRDDLQPE